MEHDEGSGDSPRTAHTGGNLNKELCAVFMYLVHELFKLIELLLTLPKPFAEISITYGSDSGDDKTDIVLCLFNKESGSLFIEMVGLHPSEQRCTAHGAENDSVLDFNIANLPWGKQCFVLRIHIKPTLPSHILKHRSSIIYKYIRNNAPRQALRKLFGKKILKRARKFDGNMKDDLIQRKVILRICCME